MEIFTFCSTSQLIFNILLFMKIIQIENIIKKQYICKYENHWNTTGFSMILVILGAQKSPPKTYFFVMGFLENYVLVQTQNLRFSHVLRRIHLPDSQKPHSEKQWKNKQNPNAPSRHWKRPSSKTSVFVTYLPPKSDDWTPPRDPPRSPQKVPKPTRGAPETPQSSPRAPQDPQDALGATNPQENQQKRTQNNIKRVKTTETSNIPTLSVQFSCSIS